jgi:predicted signal transduction protein with EAL and GGDEF domain
VVLARHLSSAEEATSIALRILSGHVAPIMAGKISHQVALGIGVALIPQNARDESEVMRKADIALYRAKAERRPALRFFEAEMDARIRERDLIERELRAAIGTDSIQPHFQPLMRLATQQVVGFEALARWQHPALGRIAPDRFIPVAESCGLINELTDHLLRQAARAASAWPEHITLAFNISALQIKDGTVCTRILDVLRSSGLAPHRLEIELTESAIVQDLRGAREVLGTLRRAGVRIALDDFGTGYSSLYHLRNFKVDKIKIDRSFVENVELEAEASALVRGLMGLGHGLGLTVLAEGVEQVAQAEVLLAQGCDQAQGFLYGNAMPAAEALTFIAAHSTAVDMTPLAQSA